MAIEQGGADNDGIETGLTGIATDTAVKRGLYIPTFDYCAQVQASTTDTWTFKTGGSGGTTVATVVITYTDATKAIISNVAQS